MSNVGIQSICYIHVLYQADVSNISRTYQYYESVSVLEIQVLCLLSTLKFNCIFILQRTICSLINLTFTRLTDKEKNILFLTIITKET